jgi:hypothetical protein
MLKKLTILKLKEARKNTSIHHRIPIQFLAIHFFGITQQFLIIKIKDSSNFSLAMDLIRFLLA